MSVKRRSFTADQGSQFTSHLYTEFLNQNNVKISMDGKNRWADNIIIERWFRTLKYEEVYINTCKYILGSKHRCGSIVNGHKERAYSIKLSTKYRIH